jgi:hypothetical protein
MRRFALLMPCLVCLVSACQEETPDSKPDAPATKVDDNVTADPVASIPSQENPPPELLSREQIHEGWVSLFDGQTLFGWKANNDVNWRVEEGGIVADTGEPGLLLTTVPFANYELRCDFHLEKEGNSGIFLRTVADPQDPSKDCYELNMCDSHEAFPTGSLVARQKVEVSIEGDGAWHTFDVSVNGPKVVVKLDGQVVIEFEDTTANPLTNGFIGLQKNAGRVAFRNVFLKPLGMLAMLDDEQGEQWSLIGGSKCLVEVSKGTVRLTDGPGYLESYDTFSDFVFQAEARTNAKNINSGFFFRAMVGDEDKPANGYELQIHNTFANGDRTQPDDYGSGFGTGAIFRRNKVRWVKPNDKEWFAITLVAHGPRFAVWVDGYQVTDIEDDRKPNKNPREGLRLKPGHLSLQAHDDKTDVSFRGLRIGKYPTDSENSPD